MAWWDQLFGGGLPNYTLPPAPWALPMYTQPPVPDYFNAPADTPPEASGFDWGEGLPKDVVRRNMPKSSAPSFDERTNVVPPWHGGASNYPGTPPMAPPQAPDFTAMRGPMQAMDASAPTPMRAERFAMTPRPAAGATPIGPSAVPPDIDRAWEVLKRGESGNKYDIMGPEVTYKSGKKDRAYGVAQVMGANIPAWTEKWLGRRMTPQEFLNDPKAQEAVGKAQFTEYARTHGIENAFAMWASGRPLSQSANDKDLAFGFSVKDIVAKRMKELGASPSATTSAAPVPAALRSPAAAPPTAEQAPRRPSFDWGPDANIWQMAMGMGQGLMKPTLYGTMGAIQQGFEGATQAAQTGQDRTLKRELMKAQISKAKEGNPTELVRNYQIARLQGYKGTMMDFAADMEAKKKTAEKTAELAATRAATEEGMGKTMAASANVVLGKIEEARKTAKDSWFATGAPAFATDFLPFTSAGELKQTVATIKANIGFDRLTQMKTESGATLGQVAIFELQALQNSLANLETATKKDVFLSRLADVERHYKTILEKYGPRVQGQSATTSPASTDMGNGWSVRVR